MSDAHLPSPIDPAGDADEELVFDEPTALDAPPVAVVEPTAEPTKPRRSPRRGRSAIKGEEDAASILPHEIESGVADPAATAEPADAPATFPPHGAGQAGSTYPMLLLAIVGLALMASLFSLGGLIAVSRTLAHAEADRHSAALQADALAAAPALVARLDAASRRLDAAASRSATQGATPASPPATIADVRHELDVLKLQLSQRQPEEQSALGGTVRDGFSEIGVRLDRMADQLDRLGKTASASPPASREAGRARPS